ncbi:hypothetical protein KSS87_005800 [Heliosperma pusillum]|nr:hypothetical protein KSS87_005800 [Heliosperma pusillum]
MACTSSGVESTAADMAVDGGFNGVAMIFPVNDGGASPKLPRRLRRRLSECRSPVTVEEIEAKLKEADIRRQQFYDLLSSKARPKQRSPSRSSPEVDLGRRIEAKLNAAEQKRLSILSKAQMRLARLEELRQAAKTGVQMEVEKKRGELGMKVESRVKQAEANRMLIMKSRRQWRAMRKERTAQSLTRRMIQENKYKERVQAAIHQKRLSAERKRLGLLEAERSKAHAWSSRVQRVANSIHNQREMERMKKRDQLEDRLQRARRQRAEFLKQRKSFYGSPNADSYTMKEQGEKLYRILARFWRRFAETKGTTFFLVKAFERLNINEKSVRSMPFEQLAYLIGSRSTLEIASSFLDRLEVHLRVRSGNNGSLGMENINHLLKRVATPVRKRYVNQTVKVGKQKKPMPAKEKGQSSCVLSRYPVRIALCAFMILGHPDAVLSCRGEDEIALAEAATKFIQEFELLTKVILEGGCIKSSSKSNNPTFRSQLEAFDKAWCLYLYRFVVWKVKDAKLLEEDLVRAACQMEVSMMHTCKLSPAGSNSGLTHDMKAIQKQVLEDQTLLKEKVQNLSGVAGIVRMENAISDARSKFFSKDTGSPFASPVAHITSPSSSSLSDTSTIVTSETKIMADGGGQSSSVARSLFKEDISSENPDISARPPAPRVVDTQLSDLPSKPFTENELLVNEIVHAQRHGFADSIGVDDVENDVKVKLKEAMEKAFWDGVVESMRQEQPDLSWVLKLMTEVRDELCEMSPESWRQEISDAIDIDILTQVLRNGTLDINYLGKIMEYALITLQKLSAPANDDEMKNAHQNLLVDLRQMSLTGEDSDFSSTVAVVKGLRFVLQQIQTLKKEISRARIRMIEPVIRGPAGLEYLQKAFSDRYGPPSNASTSLPLTKNWLSLARNNATQMWGEHLDSISAVAVSPASGAQGIPIALRTGASVSAAPRIRSLEPIAKDKEQPECIGERMDLLIRVGLLELVNQIEGLEQAVLPETLKLNLTRLRTVQSQLQKIIVVSTSMLVLRQTLVTERLLTSPSDMDNIISQSARQLSQLLEKSEDVRLEEIVKVMLGLPESDQLVVNLEKLQSTMGVVSNLLSKSLQSGDPVFSSVSRAIRLATRAVVLGGTGGKGRHLVEAALRRVGAAFLTDQVMDVGEVLIVMTTVSASVHGLWYEELLKNI